MDDIFPLPVTPFEYYYLCDDRPEYPTTFLFDLTFRGPLERGPLEGALALVLGRHPLLTARIDTTRGRRPYWVPGDLPPVDWRDDSEPMLPPAGARIDLAQSGGLQVFVRQGSERTRMVLLVHHAAADGLAALKFIEELLLAYHALFDASGPALAALAADGLKRRDPLEDPARRLSLGDFGRTVGFWLRTLAREPAPLAASSGKPGEAPLPLEFATAVLSSEQSRGLRRTATAQSATFNDLLIRDALLAAADWNSARGTRRNYLRINVPTSLRERADNDLPACNVLGFGFVSASVRPDSDPQQLLVQVRAATERIKRERTGMQFLAGLGLACCIPGFVPWALSRKRSFATLVLSNVGKVLARVPLPKSQGKLVCGGATLERITGVPPVRPLTRGALGIVNYADETTLNLRVDPHSFSRQDAIDFLRSYVARIEGSLGLERPAAPERLAARAALVEGDR